MRLRMWSGEDGSIWLRKNKEIEERMINKRYWRKYKP